VHDTHALAALQTRFAPHEVPTGLALPSTQVVVPVEHDVTPLKHPELGLVPQACPAVHAPQKPLPSQTWLVPQVRPPGWFAPSTQVCAPVAHEVVPLRHRLGLPLQFEPAVHAEQVPLESHTWLAPQLVPGVFCAPSTQASAPVEHEVVPAKHAALGLLPQVCPATHETQLPAAVQTWLLPHEVPAVFAVAESTHTCAPLAHEVTPVRQAVGLPLHAWPATHDTHPPLPLQTWLLPHETPGFLLPTSSTQTCAPLAHEVMPLRQMLGLVAQVRPALQATHMLPELQTWPAPQLAPTPLGAPRLSTHADMPEAQLVWPA
jgi:hypothetical protein